MGKNQLREEFGAGRRGEAGCGELWLHNRGHRCFRSGHQRFCSKRNHTSLPRTYVNEAKNSCFRLYMIACITNYSAGFADRSHPRNGIQQPRQILLTSLTARMFNRLLFEEYELIGVWWFFSLSFLLFFFIISFFNPVSRKFIVCRVINHGWDYN